MAAWLLPFTFERGESLLTSYHSIVTVHGLAEAGAEPWKDTDQRSRWLEPDLFKHSNARVIVFNYNSGQKDISSHTKSGLEATAKRLLERLIKWRNSADEVRTSRETYLRNPLMPP